MEEIDDRKDELSADDEDEIWIDHAGDEDTADPDLLSRLLRDEEMTVVDRTVDRLGMVSAVPQRRVIVVQRGHCHRTTGKTGTAREQEFNDAVGSRIASRLDGLGYAVHLTLANDSIPASDVFVALHCDGHTRPEAHGASVGYPDAEGGRLAAAWKRAHQRRGFTGGFRPDNNTKDLSRYYGFRHSTARFRFVAEHGFLTNPSERTWLFDHLDECAQAHVDAIGEMLGHPQSEEEPDMLSFTDPKNGCKSLSDRSGAVFNFGPDGRVGGHYLGGLNNHPEWNAGEGHPNGPVVAIEPWDDGNAALSGYVIITRDSGGRFHNFNFPSDGRLAH